MWVLFVDWLLFCLLAGVWCYFIVGGVRVCIWFAVNSVVLMVLLFWVLLFAIC